MIACTHPGKMGDALYSLPTIKYLCESKNTKADFYTSSYCAPMREVFEHQPYINKFIVLQGWEPDNFSCGGQPWSMPVKADHYETLYQLGFRNVPDTRLDHFIAKQIGINPDKLDPVSYKFPEYRTQLPDEYYVIAPRGITSFQDTFQNLVYISDKPVVQIGSIGDMSLKALAMPVGMLETLYIMSKAAGFVGLMSSNLVLANGFHDLKKVSPHDGRSWDMRHVIYSDTNFYPINPTAEEILQILKD